MFDNVQLLLKRTLSACRHSGTGTNHSLLRLARQGLYYYMHPGGRAAPPMTLFLTINGSCNLRCRMCDIGQRNESSMFYKNLRPDGVQDFPYERFKTLMDEVKVFRPYIGVTTTEPLLYPHMFDAVAYAKARGMEMNISTNGLLVEGMVQEIMDSGLHRLSVSLDGPPEVHDAMRGMPGVYDKVIRGLRAVAEEKKRRGTIFPQVYLTSFICDTNYRHLVPFMEQLPRDLFEWLNVKLMVFFTREMVDAHNRAFGDRYPATDSCFPDDFTPENLDIDTLVAQCREVNARFGDFCSLHFEPESGPMRRYFYTPQEFMDSTRCVLPWFVSQIKTNGDLTPLTRCYDMALGNIMDTPFLEAWNGAPMRSFRKDLRRHGRFPGCARCDGVLYR